MTAVYFGACVVGFLAVAVVATVLRSMSAEHQDHELPTQHHLGRVVWIAVVFCVVAVGYLLWLPAATT